MSSANRKLYSFLIWLHFTSFSSLNALRFPLPCRKDMVRVDTFDLFLILEEKSSAFYTECDVNCGLVIHSLYYIEICFSYTQFVEGFHHLCLLQCLGLISIRTARIFCHNSLIISSSPRKIEDNHICFGILVKDLIVLEDNHTVLGTFIFSVLSISPE